MTERIRGMHPWDFHSIGMVVTELHENHELTDEGFSHIALQVGDTTKYFHFDLKNLADAEEQAMELWLAIREARKENSQRSLLMKVGK